MSNCGLSPDNAASPPLNKNTGIVCFPRYTIKFLKIYQIFLFGVIQDKISMVPLSIMFKAVSRFFANLE